MKGLILFLMCCAPCTVLPQEQPDSIYADSLYLEDQFYVGLSYNFLLDKPSGITQRNLSYGLSLGFIRDIPLNKERNIALGLGLGYAVNSYFSNLFANDSENTITYSVAPTPVDLKRGKIENHLVEFPLELRWRTSTPEEFKFWRIYGGIKMGYVFSSRFKFVTDTDIITFTNNAIRNFQYGLTLNFGYNTFNIHAYYSLVKLFDDGTVLHDTNEKLNLRPLRIGVIFYIL